MSRLVRFLSVQVRDRIDGAGRLAGELRNVVLLALFIIGVLGAHFYAYAYPSFVRVLVEESERDAVRAAQVLQSLALGDSAGSFEPDPARTISIESVRIALGVLKFKIFDHAGRLTYSSDGADIGRVNESPYFREIVALGKTHTHVVQRDDPTLEGERYVQDVVETYVPVMEEGRFAGAFEIYYDITAWREDLDQRVRTMNFSIATLLVLLLGVFAVIVMRSYAAALQLEREQSRRLHDEIEHRLRVEEELRASSGHYRHLAHHDPLTGIANRTLFLDRFEHALANARRHGTRLALLFIDLDHFKPINDTYGHEAGDRILKTAARILQGTVRESDTAARIAGDEFAVLLEHADETTVQTLVDRLSRELNGDVCIGSDEIRTSASIGVSLYPDHGEDMETLLHHADLAMYSAKAVRRGSWRYYTHDPDPEPASG
jgi:diguanylate cyclase (GGDEF)-like protein